MHRFSVSRRAAIGGALATACAAAWPAEAAVKPRARVIADNDFSGDPDGLFQLAHHLLSPSVTIPLVIGSHLHADEAWGDRQHQAARAAAKASELAALIRGDPGPSVIAGAEAAIASRSGWHPSPATEAIVREAMRSDTRLPLYYCAGAGLTELALAWLSEPAIAKRLKLVWIGGPEHKGLAYPPPGKPQPEYNLTIDRLAAQILFDESGIEIWQVPRDAYRQMLIGLAELDELAAQSGALGRWLKAQLDGIMAAVGPSFSLGETYALGDSPLVTLTALQSAFEPDPSSSRYALRPTPQIGDDGGYRANPRGRPMRVYTQIDTRLTFGDMAAKFRAFGHGS